MLPTAGKYAPRAGNSDLPGGGKIAALPSLLTAFHNQRTPPKPPNEKAFTPSCTKTKYVRTALS